MASCLQLSTFNPSAHSTVPACRLLEQYMLRGVVLLAEIQSTRSRLALLEQEHQDVMHVIAEAQARLNSTGVNRLPTEILSKVFELVSEAQEGAIIWLSHVCRDWRTIAFASPRAWSKLLADLSAPSNGPTAERALAYLDRSGACPLDIRLIASAGQLSNPSDGITSALHNTLSRWRTFSFVCSNSAVSSNFVNSLSGRAPALEELSLTFQSAGRAHADFPQLSANFSVQAPLLRVLRLDSIGINLEWASALQRLNTLELVQNTGSPLAYDALLRTLSSCAESLRTVKIHARVSNIPRPSAVSESTRVIFPRLETLDLTLHTSPVASLLANFEAPNLQSLSLQDIHVPSDRWCSLGIRSFLRQPASHLHRLRLCASGLDDEELIWMLNRMPQLESLDMINSNITDAVLRALSRPAPPTSPTDAESWIVPSLNTITIEQCHQITGSALVDSIKARNARSAGSLTHTPIRHLHVRNCYHFERRHSVKLNKLNQVNTDIAWFTFGQGLGGMRTRSPHQNIVGVSSS